MDILSGFQMVFDKKVAHLPIFQMVALPDFRSRSKSGPVATQTLFDHLKFRLVRISDPYCIWIMKFKECAVSSIQIMKA